MSNDSCFLTYKVKYKCPLYNQYTKIARKFLNYCLDVKNEFKIKQLKAYYKANKIKINPRAISLLTQFYENKQIRKILKQRLSDNKLDFGRDFLKNLPYNTFKSNILKQYNISLDDCSRLFSIKTEAEYVTKFGNDKKLWKFKVAFWNEYNKYRLVNSTKEVGQFWKGTNMPSVMVNATIRKYITKDTKRINNIILKINRNSNEIQHDGKRLIVKCKGININVKWRCPRHYQSINSIEIGKDYLYVSVSHKIQEENLYTNKIGIDRNCKGNIACGVSDIADDNNRFVIKKFGQQIHQIKRKLWHNKKINQRHDKHNCKESHFTKNLDHQISRKIVNWARETQSTIVLEDLKDVRQARCASAFKRYLNSWSHFRLKTLIDYKAKMYGIPVKYVDPAYTSQDCSKCDGRTKAKGKKYKCQACNHHSHRDINAAFNILDRI